MEGHGIWRAQKHMNPELYIMHLSMVPPLVGGRVPASGGDLTKGQKFWSLSQGVGSIYSSNVIKISTQGQNTKQDTLCTYL